MKHLRNSGFSLIELMVALGVLVVLLAVGAPAFINTIKNNRLLSEVYALRATLNNARSEALARRTFVTLCRSSDGASCNGNWNEGYIAFTDDDGNGVFDPNGPAADELFLSKVMDNDTLNLRYSNGLNRVRFDSKGFARGFNGTLEVCDDRGPSRARGVILSAAGSVSAAIDTDSTPDGIVNDHSGVNFDCL